MRELGEVMLNFRLVMLEFSRVMRDFNTVMLIPGL